MSAEKKHGLYYADPDKHIKDCPNCCGNGWIEDGDSEPEIMVWRSGGEWLWAACFINELHGYADTEAEAVAAARKAIQEMEAA